MANSSDLSDSASPAQDAAPAPPSPYPTVQILQAAMAHRDSIRRSFESQRATLAEAIAAQKQAVTQAVANTQRPAEVREGEAAFSAQIASGALAANPHGVATADPMPVGANLTEKLVIALSLLTTPGSVEAKNAAARRTMAIQQFLDALRALIAEEVLHQVSPNGEDGEPSGAAIQESSTGEAVNGAPEPTA
jgi:hypothetical protein